MDESLRGRVPMRSSVLVLFLLVSAQTVATIRGDSCTTAAAQQQEPGDSPNSIPTVDPKLFTKRHYLSPRVLFSSQPPDAEPAASQGAGRRSRRRAGQPQHRGMYSVCESISVWVGNKTKATDILGNEVTVLPDVNINNVNKKQYFFETTCQSAPSGSSGCLGIDARHWNSYCTNSHTFVRALTSWKNLVAWRLIRINVAYRRDSDTSGGTMSKVQGGMKCVKYLLFVFNFVFWLSGLLVLAVGLWLRFDPETVELLTDDDAPDTFFIAVYILLGAGSLMMVVGFFGCFGAVRESQCLLASYEFFTCLMIIFGAEIAAGVFGFMNKEQIVEEVQKFYSSSVAPSTTSNGTAIALIYHRTDCLSAITDFFNEKLHIIGYIGIGIAGVMEQQGGYIAGELTSTVLPSPTHPHPFIHAPRPPPTSQTTTSPS
ncbi:hypothetical protein INR49_014144 [Caranx melampygus]|nr:hypothetical protein INR49_014144 [Caranx melampygus]